MVPIRCQDRLGQEGPIIGSEKEEVDKLTGQTTRTRKIRYLLVYPGILVQVETFELLTSEFTHVGRSLN